MVRLSVIVPTRDRAAFLYDCLHSLTRQTISASAFEVIVVNNGSVDETPDVVQRFSSELPLRCIGAPAPGLHVGRHAGLRAAASDILVFADDDIVASPRWLESIDSAFCDNEVALVGGNNRPIFESPPPDWLMRWWEFPSKLGRSLPLLSILDLGEGEFDIDTRLVWGCNFSVRRVLLEEAGGFHPDGMPHEMRRFRGDGETAVAEAIAQKGLRARFHSGASVFHRVPAERMCVEYFERRSLAQGISDSFTDLRRHGGKRSGRAAIARLLRASAGALKSLALAGNDRAGRSLREVRQRCLRAYVTGYCYHQKEVANDAKLREWVLQETYF